MKALFEAVVERSAAERDAFLSAATAGDVELRREVESLLASDAAEVSFFDRLSVATGTPRADSFTDPQPSVEPELSNPVLGPRQRIGPYEVVASLGAGGMGEVYRARDTEARSRCRAQGPTPFSLRSIRTASRASGAKRRSWHR